MGCGASKVENGPPAGSSAASMSAPLLTSEAKPVERQDQRAQEARVPPLDFRSEPEESNDQEPVSGTGPVDRPTRGGEWDGRVFASVCVCGALVSCCLE